MIEAKEKITLYRINAECDKCGGRMTYNDFDKHLGNKRYVHEHTCKVCGLTEWFDKIYPQIEE